MRALVVVSHPVAESFLRAAGQRAVDAMVKAGHDVELIDVDGVLPSDKCTSRSTAEALAWATDLVLVYPTWFGAAPASLMLWLESVAVEGLAWKTIGSRRHGLLGNIKSVWVVTAHGSSKWVNLAQGESGLRFVRRAMRFWCSAKMRVHWVAFYGNDHAGDSERLAFLDKVTRRFGSTAG